MLLAACSAPAPDVYLVTLDTLRADVLGVYGASPSPSPHLDRWGAEGVVVDEMMTTAPLTLPAHASLLTGLSLQEHGLLDNGDGPLAPQVRTLAEAFSERGYATGAFVGSMVLDSEFGLDQGFDTYVDGFDTTHSNGRLLEHSAETVLASAAKWSDERPKFTWIHLYDAHLPYQAPAPFSDQWSDGYLAEIAYIDDQLGEFLDASDRPKVVLIVGDHGEGRGDHGERTHGLLLYRSTLRVPMILWGEGVAPERVMQPRSTQDVPATLWRAATGGDFGRGTDVRQSREELVKGATVLPEWHWGMASIGVVQDTKWRYIAAPRPELYAWTTDPGETQNVVEQYPEIAGKLAAAVDIPRSARQSPDERFIALGYTEGWPLPAQELVDPKDHPDLPERFADLLDAQRRKPPAEAAIALQAFTEEHPQVGAGWWWLSTARLRAGDAVGSAEALVPLRESGRSLPLLQLRDAEIALALGNPGEARTIAQALTTGRPGFGPGWAMLAESQRRLGDCEGAELSVAEGLTRAPDALRLRVIRASCRELRGDFAGSREDAEAVLAKEEDPEARLLVALDDVRRGDFESALPVLERAPDSPSVRTGRGLAYYGLGRYELARPLLEQAAHHDEKQALYCVLLADTLLRLGAPADEVGKWLLEAEKRQPDRADTHRIRSAWHLAAGRTEEAVKEMAAAQAVNP